MATYAKTHEQHCVELAYHFDGAKIEYKNHRAPDWIDIQQPHFDWRFGDYRVKEEAVKPPPEAFPDQSPESTPHPMDFIPWDAINERFTHAAREPNGMIFVYETAPEIIGGGFSKRGHHLRIDHILNCKPSSAPWPKSVQERSAGSNSNEAPTRLKVIFNSGKVTFAPIESPTVADCIDAGLLIELHAKQEAYTTPVEAIKPLILSGCGRQPKPSPEVQKPWEIAPETRRGTIFQ